MTGAPRALLHLIGLVLFIAACAGGPPHRGAAAPDDSWPVRGAPVGRAVIDTLSFPPLRFSPMAPSRFELSNGVTVFHMHDPSLPLVDVFADFKGGYAYLDRSLYGAASSMGTLLRTGGTESLPPDSVDRLLEHYALGLSTASNGARYLIGMNALRRHTAPAIELWADLIRRPRFDVDQMEIWRGREIESARRIRDFPGSLAVMEFNRLMFGDHSTGWQMRPADLTPDRMNRDAILEVHRRVFCPQHMVIGIAGDIGRREARDRLEAAFGDWAPCAAELEEPAPPQIRPGGGVFLVPKDIAQSTIVVGHAGGVLLEDAPEYFSSRIANWILGGAGFSSRLMKELRTEEGLAYSASSIWGASRRHERIFGAITHTKAESTVRSARLLVSTIADMRAAPPDTAEVELARENIVNGFVFGFSSPLQIVSRQVSYLADGFPADWMDRYVRGINRVEARDVHDVMLRHVRPDSLTILVVGDTARFDASLSELGPVTVIGEATIDSAP